MPRLNADDLARFRADYHECRTTIMPLIDEIDALTAERDNFRALWKSEQQCSVGWVEAHRRASEGRDRLLLDLADALADVERLQGIVNGLADRVVAQSELLSRRAEKAAEGGG